MPTMALMIASDPSSSSSAAMNDGSILSTSSEKRGR